MRPLEPWQRIRQTLDPTAELNRFVRRPKYEQRCNALAAAMQNGDLKAFQQFVAIHRPLARYGSKRLIWWFGMDRDDAEQIAVLGLMRAARRFRPDLGYQFSTYANWWIRQACQRYGPDAALAIRVPPNLFWPCFRLRHDQRRLIAKYGPSAGREQFEKLLEANTQLRRQWPRFQLAMNVRSLSDPIQPEFCEARLLADSNEDPVSRTIRTDQINKVRVALGKFAQRRPRLAQIIRLRYGIDGQPLTLGQVGRRLGISRERVRQLQVKAEEHLRLLILNQIPGLAMPPPK